MALLKGKTALVTGASAGIGQSTVRRLSAAGARVICAARSRERLQALAEEIDGQAFAVELDVCSEASVDSLLEQLPSDWHSIDILVNNAGSDIGGRQLFHEGSIEQWAGTIDTNVIGLMRVTRALVPGMIERGGGHIVNIGSVAGLTSVSGCSAYVASKHAVHGFSESLRTDYAGTGIRVSEVLPGMVKTEFAATRFASSERGDQYYENYGLCLEADDIARSVLFVLEQPAHAVISQLVMVPDNSK